MRTLARFLSVLQITREQPQYGYFLTGVRAHETSNLAEHHYLVTMTAWMLCEYINETEQLIDTNAVIKMCMVHDLGELFGGDIAAPLSRRRPDIKEHAKKIEAINFDMLTSLLSTKVKAYLTQLFDRSEVRDNDAGLIVKFADYIETQFFLEHINKKSVMKAKFYFGHVRSLVDRIRDVRIREKMLDFCRGFEDDVREKGPIAGEWIVNGQ